ncbi:unnamed protein product [Rhodiola kirilowii]
MEINNEEDFLQELLALRRSPQTSSWDSTTSTATFSTQMSHNNNVLNNNNFIISSSSSNNVWSTTPCFSDNNNHNSFPIISSSSWDPSVDPHSFTTNHLTTFNQFFHNPAAATFAADQLQDQHHHHTNLQFCSSAPPNMMEDETASFLIQQDDFFCDPFSGFEDDHCHHQVLGSNSLMDEDQAMMMMMMHSNQGPKIEPAAASSEVVPSMFNVGCGGNSDFLDRKSGKASKKVQGQPSKNLMAERRRRKRLNDRLSMLRSIVPKISKMDRTSIVGDTIDYMKELLERIQRLQEELDLEPSHDEAAQLVDLFKDLKPNEVQIRNTPKFEVKRRNMKDMRVEIRCSGKPGLLLSTVNTMETLGLEIEQCVISCFNEFEMHASCSEDMDRQRNERDCDEIKDALFRNAGYGGRCL